MSGPERVLELQPVPPVMVLGDSVTYSGQAAVDVARLLGMSLDSLERRARGLGQSVPERYLLLRFAAEQASADIRTSPDVRVEPTSPESTSDGWVGVREAMGLLEVGDRQARRRIQQAGGHLTRKGWRVERDALLADNELRRTG